MLAEGMACGLCMIANGISMAMTLLCFSILVGFVVCLAVLLIASSAAFATRDLATSVR